MSSAKYYVEMIAATNDGITPVMEFNYRYEIAGLIQVTTASIGKFVQTDHSMQKRWRFGYREGIDYDNIKFLNKPNDAHYIKVTNDFVYHGITSDPSSWLFSKPNDPSIQYWPVLKIGAVTKDSWKHTDKGVNKVYTVVRFGTHSLIGDKNRASRLTVTVREEMIIGATKTVTNTTYIQNIGILEKEVSLSTKDDGVPKLTSRWMLHDLVRDPDLLILSTSQEKFFSD